MSQLKLILIAIALGALMLVLKTCGSSATAKAPTQVNAQNNNEQESGIQQIHIGGTQPNLTDFEADSPKDAVRTLVAHVKQTMQHYSTIKNSQDKIASDHQHLTHSVKEVQDKHNKITDSLDSIEKKIESMHKNLDGKLQHGPTPNSMYTEQASNLLSDPNNSGQTHLQKPQYVQYQDLGAEHGGQITGNLQSNNQLKDLDVNNSTNINSTQRTGQFEQNNVPPVDAVQLAAVQPQLIGNEDGRQTKQVYTSVEARYTIPENTTLVNAVLYTGLLGRIPVQGVIDDPYPFTVLVAADNLAAMGFKIPNIRGMIMRGRAKGDLNLSCVSGDIVSATYIFEDGTIKTFHGETSKPLAVIEDQQGLPCIPGKLITNAPKFLAIRVLLGGIAAGAQASAQTETTTTVSGDTGLVNSTVTGNKKDYILNNMGAKAAQETNQWWQERMKQSFDVVFVKPGTHVSLLIMQEMQIDLDTSDNARKVKHKVSNNKAKYHQSGLD